MALSLNVHNKSNLNAIDSSYLGLNNGFIIYLTRNAYYFRHRADHWRIPNESFTGIMLENLSIDFNIPWGEAAGAVIGAKVAKYANSKFISMLAGQADAGFQPFICSDAWTQMKVKGEAEPVKINLKFRAFNEDRLQCTNYNDIIRFLIHICSPIYSSGKNGNNNPGVFDQVKTNVENAVAGVENVAKLAGGTVTNLGKAGMDFVKSIGGDSKSGALNAGKTIIQTADAVYNTIVSNTGAGKNNGNFTVDFSLGNIGKRTLENPNTSGKSKPENKINRTYLDTKTMLGNGNTESKAINIDWIVKSFTFTPSRQFELINNVPKPLWINFDLTLETRYSLSNRYIYEILLQNKLNIIK